MDGRAAIAGESGTFAASSANYFDRLFHRLVTAGVPEVDARCAVVEAYLDSKPNEQGKSRLSRRDRDQLFWSSVVVASCTADEWRGEAMVLAITRYLGQEKVSAGGLVGMLARSAPDALVLAVRRCGLALSPRSPRRIEVDEAAASSETISELCKVLDIFDRAHRERVAVLERCKAECDALSAFDLLTLASLYAFENLVPHSPTTTALPGSNDGDGSAWDAINDLLVWKLRTSKAAGLKIDDTVIARSLEQYMTPLLFPKAGIPGELNRSRVAFRSLIDAQIELNAFLSRSIEAFCFNDAIRFERRGTGLVIAEIDPAATARWHRDGHKLARLQGYWLHRAFYAFAASDFAGMRIGWPENEDDNRLAYIRAMATQLRLREVYGVADTVSTEPDAQVDVFQALLALELMSVFFVRDVLAEFATLASANHDWVVALRVLALNGLIDGDQNRFALTWSDRAAKVAKITGWTVTAESPRGSARMAGAILDFWTYDMASIAQRLRRAEPGLVPRLFERPVLKFGATLVQLPWVVGLQNNSTAAVNNLRRLGTRRGEARAETQRIEASLARSLAERGFRVLTNWVPPDAWKDAGEVDVIAQRDGRLFVLEVKSTFIRQSMRDAWMHATTTLRKAGRQLNRKVSAVRASLGHDVALDHALDFAAAPVLEKVHVWIVDTSIECDHQRFAGFLKVSLEEVLIALRDDSRLLDDPEGLLAGKVDDEDAADAARLASPTSLYPHGFNAGRFVEVVETEVVWGKT